MNSHHQPGPDLPRSTPAAQGVDPTGIDDFLAATATLPGVELHSLLVVRHDHVVAEQWWQPYRPPTPHLLYSLSKSFTSTALGFAVDEGSVDLDATVLSYFPEFDGEVTDERSRSIRVRHVAAMASGHEDETFDRAMKAGDGDMLRGFLLTPPEREPGTVFAYNQPCTFAVGSIVRRVSGGSLTDFLRPRLFEPLGITPYGWARDSLGRELGFSGLHVPTEAIAKLGQLYLREGEWAGRRLLSAAWVAEATRSHIATGEDNLDWDQGYGFQFWRSRHGYRGDGAYGQFMLILPEADAVVAITSQSPDMQSLLDAVWTHLLPALTADASPGQTSPPTLTRSDDPAAPSLASARPGDSVEPAQPPSPALDRSGDSAEPVQPPLSRPDGPAELVQPPLSRPDGPAEPVQPPLSRPDGSADPVRPLELARPTSDGPAGAFTPAILRPGDGNELRSLHTVELRPGELVLTDDGGPLVVPLGDADGWMTSGPVASAYAWVGGLLQVDVAFVEAPHRLHVTLDQATGQFAARWETVPLGEVALSEICVPIDQ